MNMWSACCAITLSSTEDSPSYTTESVFDPRTGSRTCSGKTFPRIPFIPLSTSRARISRWPLPTLNNTARTTFPLSMVSIRLREARTKPPFASLWSRLSGNLRRRTLIPPISEVVWWLPSASRCRSPYSSPRPRLNWVLSQLPRRVNRSVCSWVIFSRRSWTTTYTRTLRLRRLCWIRFNAARESARSLRASRRLPANAQRRARFITRSSVTAAFTSTVRTRTASRVRFSSRRVIRPVDPLPRLATSSRRVSSASRASP